MSIVRCCDAQRCIICAALIKSDEEACRVTVPSKKIAKAGKKAQEQFIMHWDLSKASNCFHTECWKAARKGKKIVPAEQAILEAAEDFIETFSSVSRLEEQVDEVVKMLAEPKIKVVSFTGAGISASAGIPTYRGADGLDTLNVLASNPDIAYKKEAKSAQSEVVDLTSPAAPSKDSKKRKASAKQEVQEVEVEEDFSYNNLEPTLAHRSLAQLEAWGKLHGCITQNCDNLHAKGGVSQQLISDLHGNVFKEYCETCETEYTRDYAVDQYSTDCHAEPYYRKCSTCGWNHYTGRLCDTGRCRGKLRDTIVNFGDDLHLRLCGGLMRAKMGCRCADVCLTLGTSLTVYPASELPLKARNLVIVNLQATDLDDRAKVRVWATCDDFFRLLMPKLEAALTVQREKEVRQKEVRLQNKKQRSCV